MPLVRIDAVSADLSLLHALGRAVHDALVQTIGCPPNDRLQILYSHDGSVLTYEDYRGTDRDSGTVKITITLRAGGMPAEKQMLHARIVELAYKYAGTDPDNVFITVTEDAFADWPFGNGVAQYVRPSVTRSAGPSDDLSDVPVPRQPSTEVNRDPGKVTKGPHDKFSGDVWLWPRIGATRNTEVRNVLFTPGSRSAWHRHPGGQVLHITEGVGLVQARGGERQEIKAGDTVVCHPGQEHWHGAAPDGFMTHIAVTDGATQWNEHVTDEEYQSVDQAPGH